MRLSAPPLPLDEPEPSSLGDWLLTPLAVVYNLPLKLWIAAFFVLLIGLGALGWELSRGNTDLAGLGRPAFDDLQFSSDYKHITSQSDGRRWDITYEQRPLSAFTGTVRHVEHWRDASLPFMTHDVLVTTGDYADSRKVSTNVFDHHFTWWADTQPAGTINLLHILPLDEAIYNQLLELKDWQVVRLSGPEVLRIDVYDANGKLVSYWQDAGCNTTLVTAVTIQSP